MGKEITIIEKEKWITTKSVLEFEIEAEKSFMLKFHAENAVSKILTTNTAACNPAEDVMIVCN